MRWIRLSLLALLACAGAWANPITPLTVAKQAAKHFDCGTYLAQLIAEAPSSGREISLADIVDFGDPNVPKTLAHRRGRHGGKITVLEKNGDAWGSSHEEYVNAPQGDPRWILSLLGEQAAAFLGFRMIDATHMTVPDAKELNGGIAKINAWLIKQHGPGNPYLIDVGFYEQVPKIARVRIYNQRFRDGFRLPLSPNPSHRMHDLSFHTGAIFMPKAALERGAKFAEEVDQLAIAFSDRYDQEIRKVTGKPVPADVLRALQAITRLTATGPIDVGTGTLSVSFLSFKEDAKYGTHQESPFAESIKAMQGLDPDLAPGADSSMLTGMKRWQEEVNQSPRLTVLAAAKIELFNKDIPLEKLLEVEKKMETFYEEYFAQRAKEAPELAAPSPLKVDELCKQVPEKVKAVREAILALQKEKN